MKTNKLVVIFIMMITFLIVKPPGGEAANVVNPKETYTYDMMVRDIRTLAEQYPNLIHYKTIGNSEYGRPIYAVSLGTGNANLFMNGSHHAREWITTNLNMYMLEQYAQMYQNKQSFGGYDVKETLDETTIWFVPMVNPDGVTLQQQGLKAFPASDHPALVQMNEGSKDFKKWKANAKGVDLNRQYDADWKNIKNNFGSPRWMNHKGYYPEQAAETKAIVKFTKEIDPEMAVAYHSSGEILFWNFHQTGQIYTRDKAYAQRVGQLTGYSLIYPGLNPSGGGYTDWFVSEYNRPGFTPEVGQYAGNTHVAISQFDRIWSQNKYVGLYTASESYRLYLDRGGKPKPKEVNVKIDDQKMTFDQPALLIDGNTVVPLRGVFEHLGAEVEWDANNRTILVRKGISIVELKVGSKTMKIDDDSVTLEVAPQVINNRTLIPLRAVSEAIGAEVGWEQATNTALITSPPVESDDIAPSAPEVEELTDVMKTVSGLGETNALIEVTKAGNIIGEARANAKGQFQVEIPVQTAETMLDVTATDLAGNTSEMTQVRVQYTSTFTDTIGHWSEEPIGFLKEQKITNGLSDGSFGVNKPISRAESTALLARTLKLETENLSAPPFPDVPENHFYSHYIAAVFNEGMMQGTPAGLFKPDATLTRAEMATILVNAFDLESQEGTLFADVPESHWAYEAVYILAANGFSDGYPDGTFRPDSPITRAEFGTLLANVLQEKQGSDEDADQNGTVQPDGEGSEETDTVPPDDEGSEEDEVPEAEEGSPVEEDSIQAEDGSSEDDAIQAAVGNSEKEASIHGEAEEEKAAQPDDGDSLGEEAVQSEDGEEEETVQPEEENSGEEAVSDSDTDGSGNEDTANLESGILNADEETITNQTENQ